MIRRDGQSNELARKWDEKSPERVVRFYDQFVDDAFWEELIIRMTGRDLQAEMTWAGVGEEAAGEEKWIKRKKELELHYETLFREYGLEGISLARGGEGSN